MKLVVLLPAYNEEELISETILKIPRKIIGISKVEVLVVDDGSTDKTIEIAMNAGADKIISHEKKPGSWCSLYDWNSKCYLDGCRYSCYP